jgi:hypothetical protein
MSPVTHELIDYWQRLPAHSTAVRRQRLEEVLRRVERGELGARALLPFALADVDEDLVHEATLGYVRHSGEARADALADALEWIRRGLAINRSAVFAALLGLGDESVDAALAGLCLSLEAREAERVFQRAGRRASARTRAFLQAWRELLAGGGADAWVPGQGAAVCVAA